MDYEFKLQPTKNKKTWQHYNMPLPDVWLDSLFCTVKDEIHNNMSNLSFSFLGQIT